jgi:hypothetical protein
VGCSLSTAVVGCSLTFSEPDSELDVAREVCAELPEELSRASNVPSLHPLACDSVVSHRVRVEVARTLRGDNTCMRQIGCEGGRMVGDRAREFVLARCGTRAT